MSYCHPHRQQETYLSDSNTRQRWFLWKKCLFSLKQWYLSSGSASLSLRRNSSSFKPVLCLKYNKQHSLFRIYSVFTLSFQTVLINKLIVILSKGFLVRLVLNAREEMKNQMCCHVLIAVKGLNSQIMLK